MFQVGRLDLLESCRRSFPEVPVLTAAEDVSQGPDRLRRPATDLPDDAGGQDTDDPCAWDKEDDGRD